MLWFKTREPEFFLKAEVPLFTIHMRIGKKIFSNVMKCVLYEESGEITIGDICILDERTNRKFINKGYGSRMMQMLLDYAREHGYHTIKGWLAHYDGNSPEDPHHRDRQMHFYGKFGFEFIPNDEHPDYMIVLRL